MSFSIIFGLFQIFLGQPSQYLNKMKIVMENLCEKYIY